MVGKRSVVHAKEREMQTSLSRRGSVYYVRARIPQDLLLLYGSKQEIKYSLQTADAAEARRRVRIELARIQKEFDDLRVNPVDINKLTPRSLSDIAELELKEIAALVGMHHLQADDTTRQHMASSDALSAYQTERSDYRALLRETLISQNWAAHQPAAESVLTMMQIQFETAEPKFQMFSKLLLEASLKSADVVMQRLNGQTIATTDVVKPQEVFRPALTSNIKLLADVAELMLREQAHLDSKTIAEKRSLAREFDRHFRQRTYRAAQKPDCQSFIDHLRLQNQLKPATLQKKAGFLKGLFEFAVDKEWIPNNPAAKLNLPKADKKKSRVPYEIDDIKQIFLSPIYAEGERPTAGRGEASVWLPLIALFTGARLEEIAQLRPADICKDSLDDLWVIRFTDLGDGQSLKNESSKRLVPIHDALIDAGLLRLVDQQRAKGHDRLFDKLTPDKHGILSASWSKWWGRYVRALGITDSRKVFHSFRHLFKHVLRRASVDDKISKALMGHTLREVADGYGSEDYPLLPMVAAMKQLQFPGLNIPKLL